MKTERTIQNLIVILWLCGGFVIGMITYHYLIANPAEIEMEMDQLDQQPDAVRQELDRMHERLRVEDSILRVKYPEHNTYRKYDPEDEDTWHLKPMTRHKEEVDTQNESR